MYDVPSFVFKLTENKNTFEFTTNSLLYHQKIDFYHKQNISLHQVLDDVFNHFLSWG